MLHSSGPAITFTELPVPKQALRNIVECSAALCMAKKRNTQLIITSHESRLLASEMLRNDEICFVCKTAQGKSIINPLEKYQLRADKKVYAALFDGTLDAGPSFDEEKLSRLSE